MFRPAGAAIVTVNDRRQGSRKALPTEFSVALYPVELNDGGPALVGRGADLTMGGIGVVLSEEIHLELRNELWSVSFVVSDKTGRPIHLTLGGLITHSRSSDDGHFYGLKFHDLGSPGRSKERAALRQFLLSDLRDQWQGNLSLQAPST
jgi:hypothetical protein